MGLKKALKKRFMTPTPREGNFGVKSVKLIYFFKNRLCAGA